MWEKTKILVQSNYPSCDMCLQNQKKVSVFHANLFYLLEAPPRFELGIKALQASALPLGDGAMMYDK